jgi:hypothetical protein
MKVITFSKARFEVKLLQNIIAKNRHFRHRLEIEVEEEGSHHVARRRNAASGEHRAPHSVPVVTF